MKKLMVALLVVSTSVLADEWVTGTGVGQNEYEAYQEAHRDAFDTCWWDYGGYPLTTQVLSSEPDRAFPNPGYGGVVTPCNDCWRVVVQTYCRLPNR